MIRRVEAVSRWNGVALEDETGRALARHAAGLCHDISDLRPGRYASPNCHRQARHDPTLSGHLTIHGDLAPLWPILHVATRCHIGRHAVEGLGAFQIADTGTPRVRGTAQRRRAYASRAIVLTYHSEHIVLIIIPRGPPPTFGKSFSLSGRGRIFSLYSRVMRVGLSTGLSAKRPKSFSQGRYSLNLMTAPISRIDCKAL